MVKVNNYYQNLFDAQPAISLRERPNQKGEKISAFMQKYGYPILALVGIIGGIALNSWPLGCFGLLALGAWRWTKKSGTNDVILPIANPNQKNPLFQPQSSEENPSWNNPEYIELKEKIETHLKKLTEEKKKLTNPPELSKKIEINIKLTNSFLERLKKLAHKNDCIELLKTFQNTTQLEKAELKKAEEQFEKERLQKLQNITSTLQLFG